MTKKNTKKFPTAKQLAKGPVIQRCSHSMELSEAGLRDHELKLEFLWLPDPDEEPGDVTLWPVWRYSIRRVGAKNWHKIGLSSEGFHFARCGGAGASLMKYFSDLEELLEDDVAELTYGEDEDE